MGQRNTKDILNFAAEFMLVSFLVFGLAELAKPHLVTAFLRLDYYFAILLLTGIFSLLYNKLFDR